MTDWNARRILREIAGPEERTAILTSFWRSADDHARHGALALLAKSMNFREQSLRKAPRERKVELLASRLGSPDFDDTFEVALMTHHTESEREMMAAFLDRWGVPHEGGLIEADQYEPPDEGKVDSAASELEGSYPMRKILLYLATVGLLMGEGMPAWREATWPVVERRIEALR